MPERRHQATESRDVSSKALAIFAGGFVVFLAAVLAGIALGFDTAGMWPAPGLAHQSNTASPALQRDPHGDLAAYRRAEAEELDTLGWVDRDAGIARIPIADAMRIIAETGIPHWGDAVETADEECRLLITAVPRSPQAVRCRNAPRQGEPVPAR